MQGAGTQAEAEGLQDQDFASKQISVEQDTVMQIGKPAADEDSEGSMPSIDSGNDSGEQDTSSSGD